MSRTFGALVAVAVFSWVVAPAAAHDYLVASNPEDGSTISVLPEAFSITTNQAMLDLAGNAAGFAIQVTDDAGDHYADGCVTITDATLSAEASLGAAGEYTMAWQLVSGDGHTVSGEVGFAWDPPTGTVPAVGVGEPPICGGEPVAVPCPTCVEVQNGADAAWIAAAVAVATAGVVALVLVKRRKRA